jgi:hypothetical protein
MTALWGPMGWMTLHSISVNYPENPTIEDKQVLDKFMEAFGGSITCPHCKQDFSLMFPKYKNAHPEWNTSKYNLFLAIVRMHNTVNKKLDKPSPKTVAEALELLRNATKLTSPSEFRHKYIDHVMKFWNSMRNNYSVIPFIRSSQEMNKINLEYWNLRESSYEDLPEAEIFDISYQYSSQPDLSMHKGSISRFLKKIKMTR